MSGQLAIPNQMTLDLTWMTDLELAVPTMTDEELHEADRRLDALEAAVDTYMKDKLPDGRAKLGEIHILVRQRLGVFLGPGVSGNPALQKEPQVSPTAGRAGVRKTPAQLGIDKHAAADMRKLAAHPEIVAEVIAAGTDADPPSPRKAVKAIDAATKPKSAALDGLSVEQQELVTGLARFAFLVAQTRDAASSVHKLRRTPSDERKAVLHALTKDEGIIVLAAMDKRVISV